MRATAPDRSKTRNSQSEKGESSGKTKKVKELGGTSTIQDQHSKFKSLVDKGVGEDDVRISDSLQSLAAARSPSPLGKGTRCGRPNWELMNVDGPGQEPKGKAVELGQTTTPNSHLLQQKPQTDMGLSVEQEILSIKPSVKDIEMEGVGSPSKKIEANKENSSPKKKLGKKWKRAARGVKDHQIPVKLSSPLNKMLALSQKSRSYNKRNQMSPNQRSPISKVSPKFRTRTSPSPSASRNKMGVLRSFSNSVTVVKGLRSSKIHVSSFYLGDKNILWVFRSITERDNFIRNKWLWEEQFSSVGVWSKSMTPQSRLSWAEFRGIPLHCWCEEFFKRLGWAVGEPLLVDEETLKRKKLDYGKILVLIPYGQSCPDGIKVISGSSSFSVAVWENPVPVNSEWISKWQGVGEDASFPANDSLYDTQLTMAAVGIMF
ncbi:hypothetical protein LWI29_008359 [Acer saccharum]|uniref:DUF4283 domain-containing protein n=1 Tax=Acer saccharum TaxID=4024 RepID=A0AA39SLX1_ACESA|nr:hypothetical protein LWI29_008359 [Acer saccharum]